LYIGLIASESNMASLMRKCTKDHEGSIWMDDTFEIMLGPDAAGYWQIVVNSNGVYRILSRSKAEAAEMFGFKIETTARVSDNKWVVAVKVPLSQFQQADFSKPWKFNIFRNRRSGQQQNSGIQLSGVDFHVLDEYCTLVWSSASAPARIQ
jgi:hypothetical protein